MSDETAVLSIAGLQTSIVGRGRSLPAVGGVDIEVRRGEIVAVVGESGSGKSLTALSVMRLLREPVRVTKGSVQVAGREVVGLGERSMRQVRGGDVAIVFQDPMSALNPYQPVGKQIAEAIVAHRKLARRQLFAETIALLREVAMPLPELRARQYPHELSGGMRQRVLIAIALANRPRVLIADEPTTGLDTTIQAQVIELFRQLNQRHDMAIVMITHNLGVVAGLCERTYVMYAGKVVESGPTAELFATPRHPYTAALLGAVPRMDTPGQRLVSIPDQPPDLARLPSGCAFHPRCAHADAKCRSDEPGLQALPAQRELRCWHPLGQLAAGGAAGGGAAAGAAAGGPELAPAVAAGPGSGGEVLLSASGLVKRYQLRGQHRRLFAAVDHISFEVRRGEAFGIVGESGCGKSTLGRMLAALETPSEGSVRVAGRDVAGSKPAEVHELRRTVQYVFQDPFSSLDPRQTVERIVGEPLSNFATGDRNARRRRVLECLDACGLGTHLLSRHPHELSGGQRQRVGIARALALSPQLLILDEPLSALDVSVQAQIVNLLQDLQRELALTYVFISHDLGVVRHLCSRLAVMYLGRFVEQGTAEQIFGGALHPYTEALMSSIPVLDPGAARARITLVRGEAGAGGTSGCSFASRCPVAEPRCTSEIPHLTGEGRDHPVACHIPGALHEQQRAAAPR